MARIIKNGSVVEDDWQLQGVGVTAEELPAGRIIVPLAFWQSHREELIARGAVGVWLDSTEEPQELAGDVDTLPLIAINFPEFKDGRGYSLARILRDRLGFQGELRAIGDVLRDQLFYMKRCGFDAFAIRPDRDPEQALASLRDFRETYQAATDNPLPLFRRRGA